MLRCQAKRNVCVYLEQKKPLSWNIIENVNEASDFGLLRSQESRVLCWKLSQRMR